MSDSALVHIEAADCFDGIIDLLGDVREARGLSCQRVDEIIGVTGGLTNKILGPRREKGLSPMMLDGFLTTFAIKLVAVDDPEAIARMAGRWELRDETSVRQSLRISRRLLRRARPVILQEVILQLAAEAWGDGKAA